MKLVTEIPSTLQRSSTCSAGNAWSNSGLEATT